MDLYQILVPLVGVILAILTGTFGTQWALARKKAAQAAKLLADALTASEDGTLTVDELKLIATDAMILLGLQEPANQLKAKMQARRSQIKK